MNIRNRITGSSILDERFCIAWDDRDMLQGADPLNYFITAHFGMSLKLRPYLTPVVFGLRNPGIVADKLLTYLIAPWGGASS